MPYGGMHQGETAFGQESRGVDPPMMLNADSPVQPVHECGPLGSLLTATTSC
jgi:hypothetical protein